MNRTPIRKRRKGGPRRGPWRSVKYRRWIAEHTCLICRKPGTQAAHTERGGMSMKGPDSSCVPLCPLHHDEYDGRQRIDIGWAAVAAPGGSHTLFEVVYKVNMKTAAAWYFSMWPGKKEVA